MNGSAGGFFDREAENIFQFLQKHYHSSFQFGTIAFLQGDTERVNTRLLFGMNMHPDLKSRLVELNERFDVALADGSAMSMTGYMQKEDIKVLRIEFEREVVRGGEKEDTGKAAAFINVTVSNIHILFGGGHKRAQLVLDEKGEFTREDVGLLNTNLSFGEAGDYSRVVTTLNFYLEFYREISRFLSGEQTSRFLSGEQTSRFLSGEQTSRFLSGEQTTTITDREPGNTGVINLIRPSSSTSIFDGLCYLYTTEVLDKKDEYLLSYMMTSQFVEYAARRFNSEAVKSAKAAIMSRNMSHNLGSHVKAYLKLKLASVEDIIRNDSLRDLSKIEDENALIAAIRNIPVADCETDRVELPFLVGLGRFINYLQERQDYIATVSTNHIPPSTTVSFKDFIYDELKPELRFKRYPGNGITGREPDNLLLDYIAYSEGYLRSEDIVLKFGRFDGTRNRDKASGGEIDFEKLRNLEIAIPGGITGRQAFFSIMENIIRNAAKHSEPEPRLTIRMEVVEDESFWNDNDFDQSRIYYLESRDKYHFLIITNELRNNVRDLDIIRKGVDDLYVYEDTGRMKNNFKGIKEMRISAAWLRGYNIDEFPLGEPPAVFVRGVDYRDDDKRKITTCSIQYIICLPKPKKVALVIKYDSARFVESVRMKLSPYGWGVYSPADFKSRSTDYEMIVYTDKLTADEANEVTLLSPSRLTWAADEALYELLGAISEGEENRVEALLDNAKREFYEKWIEETFFAGEAGTAQKPSLVIADHKAYGSSNNNLEIIRERGITIGGTGTVPFDKYKGNIVFSTHYQASTREEAAGDGGRDEAVTARLQQTYFIEGVSGANSTDRLIRKSAWDYDWYYKLMAAGLSRVAIFDERIFEIVSPKSPLGDGGVISLDELVAESDLERCKTDRTLRNGIYPSLRDKLSGVYKLEEGIVDELMIKLSGYIEAYLTESVNPEEARQEVSGLLDIVNVDKKGCYDPVDAQSYYEKGIMAFDMKWDKKNERFLIYGYNQRFKNDLTIEGEHAVCEVGYIARKGNGEYDISLYHPQKFDFILIHQGILDKIYQNFGIKEGAAEQAKCEFTRQFHSALSKSPCVVLDGDKGEYYLPRLIIHSGRSMPSRKDMPQRQPFIQFAAVENSVRDCKYTLMELLFSAHYEECNSNNQI